MLTWMSHGAIKARLTQCFLFERPDALSVQTDLMRASLSVQWAPRVGVVGVSISVTCLVRASIPAVDVRKADTHVRQVRQVLGRSPL